jgi:hypothetical protein
MISKKIQNKTSSEQMNLEEIMQMNDILKPYQEKTNEILEDNIKDNCTLIEVK